MRTARRSAAYVNVDFFILFLLEGEGGTRFPKVALEPWKLVVVRSRAQNIPPLNFPAEAAARSI